MAIFDPVEPVMKMHLYLGALELLIYSCVIPSFFSLVIVDQHSLFARKLGGWSDANIIEKRTFV